MAETANSTIASRRDALLGLAVTAFAAVPAVKAMAARRFDPHEYLRVGRSLGSRYMLIVNSRSGKAGLQEMYPEDGWSKEGIAETHRQVASFRADPDALAKVGAVLRAEGNVFYV